MIDSVQVGTKITQLRKKALLSQNQLADKLFITRQALSKWETGLSIPTIEMLLLLCEALDTTVDEILCLDENITIDPENIFVGHSRKFIIKKIVLGELPVDLPSIFYQLSPSERLLILREVREGRLAVNLHELKSRLSVSEIKYLGGNLV